MSLEQTALLKDRRAGLAQLAQSERNTPAEIHQFWERFYELMALQTVCRTDRQAPDYCVPPPPFSSEMITRLHHDRASIMYMHPGLSRIEQRLQLMAGINAEWDLPIDSTLDLQNPTMPFTRGYPESDGWLVVRALTSSDLPYQPSFERVGKFMQSRGRLPATLNIGMVMSLFNNIVTHNGRVVSPPAYLCLGTIGGLPPQNAFLNYEVVHGTRYAVQMRPQGSLKPMVYVTAEFGPGISGIYTVLEVEST